MADKAWKAAERFFCKALGGARRGAEFVMRYTKVGMNDCVDTWPWSVEVKNWKRPTWSAMLTDALKAADRAEDGEIGISIMHEAGKNRDTSTLVSLTWREFQKVLEIVNAAKRSS